MLAVGTDAIFTVLSFVPFRQQGSESLRDRRKVLVMLVLSRLEGDSISVPDINLAVRVLKISGGRIRLGIEAPEHVRVLRSEATLKPSSVSLAPDDGLSDRLRRAKLALTIAEGHLQRGEQRLAEAALDDVLQALGSPAMNVSESCPAYESSDCESSDCESSQLSVLVVGDEIVASDVLGELIVAGEIEVRCCQDIREAMDLLQESPADFVLLSGDELQVHCTSIARSWRQHHRFASVPLYRVGVCATDDLSIPHSEDVGHACGA